MTFASHAAGSSSYCASNYRTNDLAGAVIHVNDDDASPEDNDSDSVGYSYQFIINL